MVGIGLVSVSVEFRFYSLTFVHGGINAHFGLVLMFWATGVIYGWYRPCECISGVLCLFVNFCARGH